MSRSHDGALLFSCAALSSATPCRFISALSLITLSARASTFGRNRRFGLPVGPHSFQPFGRSSEATPLAILLLTSVTGFLIKNLRNFIIRYIMGAIAVSKKEEEQIEKLRKELGIASKSGVIRTALKILEEKSQEEKLRREIRDSVSRCATADREENKELFPAGVARKSRGE